MGFIRWIIGFIIALCAAGFAILNRHDVPAIWHPHYDSFELPLYLLCLSFMGAGFVFGAAAVWLNMSPLRQEKRRQKKQIKNLESALETAEEKGQAAEPPSDFFPALPKWKGKRI